MTPTTIKLTHIYSPFLRLLRNLLIIYSLAHWLLVIWLGWVHVDEALIAWQLPALLSIVLVMLQMSKPIGLLLLNKGRKKDYRPIYYILVMASLAAPVAATQYFLLDAAGTLARLQTPDEVAQHPNARYYTINRYQGDVTNIQQQVFSSYTGKHNSALRIRLVIAVPIYAPDSLPAARINPLRSQPTDDGQTMVEVPDTSSQAGTAPAWICWRYDTIISSQLTQEAEDIARQQFFRSAYARYRQNNTASIAYLRRPTDEERLRDYRKTVPQVNQPGQGVERLLEPVYEPFSRRYVESLFWSIAITVIAGVVMLILVLVPALDYPAWKNWQEERAL